MKISCQYVQIKCGLDQHLYFICMERCSSLGFKWRRLSPDLQGEASPTCSKPFKWWSTSCDHPRTDETDFLQHTRRSEQTRQPSGILWNECWGKINLYWFISNGSNSAGVIWIQLMVSCMKEQSQIKKAKTIFQPRNSDFKQKLQIIEKFYQIPCEITNFFLTLQNCTESMSLTL